MPLHTLSYRLDNKAYVLKTFVTSQYKSFFFWHCGINLLELQLVPPYGATHRHLTPPKTSLHTPSCLQGLDMQLSVPARKETHICVLWNIVCWRMRTCSVKVYLSLVMRKPAFCICETKDADQLRGNREADQRLCFRVTDSTIPLLPKSEISSL